MKPSIALSVLLAAVLFDSPPVVAQDDLKPYFNMDGKGLWVEGYDPVAYLMDGKATEGSERFSLVHQGATFHFASQAHLDAFRKEPAKYLPQYGGYCAYAMGATGEKVEVDPETFKVKEGKVYLALLQGEGGQGLPVLQRLLQQHAHQLEQGRGKTAPGR